MTTTATLEAGYCRSCHAAIYWVKHASTGIKAPIDRVPAADGNIAIDAAGDYRVVPAAERESLAGTLYTNHFMRCPDRARFDRRR